MSLPAPHAVRRPLAVVLALSLSALLAVLVAPTPARADGPGVGTPWVVTLGDSYISGEAGRWAGSSNDSSSRADALGPTAYFDNGSSETIDRCHRSKSAEAYIGGGVSGLNLACSGARTTDVHGRQRALQAGPRLLQRRRASRARR